MAHALEKVVSPKRLSYSDLFADYYRAKFEVKGFTEMWETKRVMIPFSPQRAEKVKAYLGITDLNSLYEKLIHIYEDEIITMKRMEMEEDKNLAHFLLQMKAEKYEESGVTYFYFISPENNKVLSGETFNLKEYCMALLRSLFALKQKMKNLYAINPCTVCTYIDNKGKEVYGVNSLTGFAELFGSKTPLEATAQMYLNLACGYSIYEKVELEITDALVPLPLADILKSIAEEENDAKLKKAISIVKGILEDIKSNEQENTEITVKPYKIDVSSFKAEKTKEEVKKAPEPIKEKAKEETTSEEKAEAEETKPEPKEEVKAEETNALKEKAEVSPAPEEERKAKINTRKEGTPKEEPKEENATPKEEPAKEVMSDRNMEYEINHDFLTACKNRRCFDREIKERDDYIIVAFDVNNLKETNDTYGHSAGDTLLKSIASEIVREFGNDFYRIGGDEFLLVLDRNVKVERGLKEVEKRLSALSKKDKDLTYSVAYGIAYKGEGSLEEVLKLADKRMYEHKAEIKAENKAREERNRAKNTPDVKEGKRGLISKNKGSKIPTGFCIGVFGLTRGAGTSQMAIELAERYAKLGLNVAMVEYDGKDALEYIGTDRSKVTYKCPTKFEREKVLTKTMGEQRDLIILDLGTPYKFSAKGETESVDKERADELMRCKIKVGCGFANMWNFGKLEYFEDKEEFNRSTVFTLLGFEDVDIESNLYTCTRDSEVVQKVIEKLI